MKLLFTVFLALVLNGAQPVWDPSTHAVVDCAAGEWDKATFPTIQGALDSGATWIEVRPCVYAETLTIATEGVTIDAQGAVLVNEGNHTSISVTAPHVTLTGDLTIQGANDGTGEGDFFQGVGVRLSAPHATIEGLKTRNLRSFSILSPTAAAHHAVLSGFDFRNVATDRGGALYSPAAVMFINGSSYNTVRDGYISGHSQGIGTWYGASHNTISGNRLEANWGYQGNGQGLIPRSAIEDYGVPGAVNTANRFINNRIDGARSAGFELADILVDTLVSGNEVRNVLSGFGAMGSGSNRGVNLTIESNTFYGSGGPDGNNWFSASGVIRDNTFVGWNQGNMGTIHIPGDALGDVDIVGNTFTGNSMVMRASPTQGRLRFMGNRITDPADDRWTIYFADTTHPAEIGGNIIQTIGGYAITSNRAAPLWIHDNQIVGHVNISAGVVEDNTIINPNSDWSPLYVQGSMVVRGNRIAASPPLQVASSANGAVVVWNYLTTKDGAAWTLPACPPVVACLHNWTVGQVPTGVTP